MFINKYIISFVKGSGGKVAFTCLLKLLLTLFSTLISFGAAIVVQMMLGKEHLLFFNNTTQVFAFVSVFIVLRFILAKTAEIKSAKCSIQIKSNIRAKLLQKLFMLGPAYTAKKRTGNIASTVSNKVEYLNEYFMIYLPVLVSSVINAVIILSIIFVFDWLVAVVCVFACIGLLTCPMVFYKIMRERGEKEMEAHSQYYSDCLDSIQGISSLKAFNANRRQRKKLHEKGEALRQAVMAQLKITMLEGGILEFFIRIGSAFSIAVAALRCASGSIAPDLLVYTLFLVGSCFTPMLKLISAWHLGYRGITASFGIDELLNTPAEISLYSQGDKLLGEAQLRDFIKESESKADRKILFDGDICFENVSFAYGKKEGDVLKNISFKIPNQTVTALVGPSGSGKSTIAHLLAGFYPVRKGTVKIGDIVLSEQTVDIVQSLISVVWQDSHIFYGTVYENIRLGKPDASQDEVIQAAKNASIHNFIESLPEGYNTHLGERGMRFSGGQRQRIAIARAFLHNAPIIIFDEATSCLDRENEIAIQKSFTKLSKGKTALVIAHRLATIRNADQICIIETGKIRDFGTHADLVHLSPHYRKLMGAQIVEGTQYGK